MAAFQTRERSGRVDSLAVAQVAVKLYSSALFQAAKCHLRGAQAPRHARAGLEAWQIAADVTNLSVCDR